MGLYRGVDLVLCELIAGEVTFHVLFTCLSNSLDQGIADNSEVLFCIFRNLTVLIVGKICEAAALHLNCIYEADELFILTDRNLERSDLSAELFLKL